VAAPATEQSWIGKAVSRHGQVEVQERDGFPGPAWAVGGTPADAVNIALGHLVDRRPDVVLSGINIGFNTTLSMILSSGTVGAALEGAGWGLPAFAFSIMLPRHLFRAAKGDGGDLPEDFLQRLRLAGRRAADLARPHAGEPNERSVVHNVNFPETLTEDTPVRRTTPARFHVGSYFQPSGSNIFSFGASFLNEPVLSPGTDRAVLRDGHISHSILDFSSLARDV
jgi:5'-nucleotidase